MGAQTLPLEQQMAMAWLIILTTLPCAENMKTLIPTCWPPTLYPKWYLLACIIGIVVCVPFRLIARSKLPTNIKISRIVYTNIPRTWGHDKSSKVNKVGMQDPYKSKICPCHGAFYLLVEVVTNRFYSIYKTGKVNWIKEYLSFC